MDTFRIFYTVLLCTSLILAVLLIYYSHNKLSMPGAGCFICMLSAHMVYCAAYIGELNSSEFSQALIWFNLEHIGIPLIHYFWLMMCLDYVCIDKKYLKKIKFLALYHPILYYLIFFTNQYHHLYISAYAFTSNGHFQVIITAKGTLYYATIISGTIFGVIAVSFYIRGMLRMSAKLRYGYLIMLLASILPWAAVYMISSNRSYLGVDYFPIVSSISGVMYVYGIFRHRLFRTIPIATEQVFRQSREGILVIDMLGQIIEANDVMKKLYPELQRITKEFSLAFFAVRHPEYGNLANEGDISYFHYEKDREKRYYQATLSSIDREERLCIGRIISVWDITQQFEYNRKLEMIATEATDKAEMNEILFLQAQIKPHFINNTLNVIASMITRAPEEAKSLITNLGEYLSDCCYFDSDSGMVPLEKELQAVETYVNIERARFRERLHFEILCDEVPKLEIPRLVLQPLVENAICHGILKKAEGGSVRLIIKQNTDKVYFEVIDNGIGMPEELTAGLIKGDYNSKGIGITNINRRLFKYYAEGLTIKKGTPGTSVSFSVPYDKLKGASR